MIQTFCLAGATTATSLLFAAFIPSHAAMLVNAGSNAGGPVCADVAGGNPGAGTHIQAWNCTGGFNQQFSINVLVNPSFPTASIYAFAGSQTCMDVAGSGTAMGTPVGVWGCNGTNAQIWRYQWGLLINEHTNLCLDAGNLANGTQLTMQACTGAASQSWSWR
jgi:hypothetical protein